MQKQLNSVKEFHKVFKIGHSEIPKLPRWEIARIRFKVSFDERKNEEHSRSGSKR
jgi:predicted HAD superfamily Cof-like phosphohydrolase